MRQLLPHPVCLLAFSLFALLPLHAKAQETTKPPAEPTYTLSLGGGNEMGLRIEAMGRERRLWGSLKPGSTGKTAIAIRVTLDADGHAASALNHGARFSGAPINLSAAITGGDGGSLDVSSLVQSGTDPVGAPVVTFVDFLAVLGRRYDWKKGGPQTFVYFDPTIRSKFASLIAESDGKPQPVSLTEDSKPVMARRLKITVDVPELSEARRTTSLYVGPDGEAIKGEMPVTRFPITASEIGAQEAEKGFITHYPNGIEPQGSARFTRVRRTAKGYTITYEGPEDLIRGTVEMDNAFRPVRTDHQETWRRMTATILPNRVLWAVPEQKITTSVRNEVWFLTHYVMTGIWENRSPFADLAASSTVNVAYPTIEWGDKSGSTYTVQRMPDTNLVNPTGKPVKLKHWQVLYAPYFAADLWTDGERLVKLASSAGPVIIRDGWETAAKSLSAPPKPSH